MKWIKDLHRWLGLLFGAILFLVCFSGAMLALDPNHGHGEESGEFFRFMFRLHRWLLDPANPKGEGLKIGKNLVGLATGSFVVIIATGIAMWWQRARRNLKRSLMITRKYGRFPFLMQLHVAGGMYVALFVAAMALTGLCWSYGWYRDGFLGLFGLEAGKAGMSVVKEIHTGGFGRAATTAIWFLASLFASSLPITGYYLYFHRRKGLHSKK